MSAYLVIICSSASRLVIVAAVSRRTRLPSEPASGLPSRATTRSPRRLANVCPSISVVVVLPTPPLRLITAIERQPGTGVLARAISSRSAISAGLGPRLTRPPVATAERNERLLSGGIRADPRLLRHGEPPVAPRGRFGLADREMCGHWGSWGSGRATRVWRIKGYTGLQRHKSMSKRVCDLH